MNISIKIELGCKEVGTKAIVTTKRLFLSPKVDVYVCHKCTPIMGSSWINEKTGIEPDFLLRCKIERAAQAAANLNKTLGVPA